MGADMKESGKMVISMAKVRKVIFIEWFWLILTLFNALIGKYFYNDGARYEGEFKDGGINGKGKKFDSKEKLIEEGIFAEGVLIKHFWITIHISSYYF